MQTKRVVLSRRALAVILVAGLLVAGGSMVAALIERRANSFTMTARPCRAAEAFSGASCRAVLSGVVLHESRRAVDLDVAGRREEMPVRLAGDLTIRPQTPVTVTYWKGDAIAIRGPSISIDAQNSSAHRVDNYVNLGVGAIWVTAVLVGGSYVALRRRESRERQAPGSWPHLG